MLQIIVVDDSRVMRDIITAALCGIFDATFTAAANGLEAIEHLALAPYHLMVLDLDMPEMDGIEVLEFVRRPGGLSSLPIVVVTGRDDALSRDRALAAGATRFLTKPFSPDTLQREVRALLEPEAET